MSRAAPPYLPIAATFLLALLVDLFPLSRPWVWLRPELVCLLVIYWVLRFPYRLGVGMAWLAGLLIDLVSGAVWGSNALSLAVVAYICQGSYQRLRSYALPQQTLWVFVFTGVHLLFFNWLQGLAGYAAPPYIIVFSALISALCWPLLVLLFPGGRSLSD